jgi:Domain of unknown function (DUF4345)
MQLKKAYLTIAFVAITIIALLYGISPTWYAATFLGITDLNPNVAHILRAVTGLYLALAAFWLYSVFNDKYRNGAAMAWPFAARAQQPTMPAETLSAQVRLQGHRCDEPLSATRGTVLSKPNEAVWVLKCANASYRLTLIPNMAARVERLE